MRFIRPATALTGLSGRYVEGVAEHRDRLIVLLGLERLLGDPEHAVAATV